MIDTAPHRTYRAGLIGSGVRDSLSPTLHEHEAAALGMSARYEVLDLDELGARPADVGQLVEKARAAGWHGLNITHPCKQLVLPHLDALSPDAAAIGAVNTVVFDSDAAVGHNTDWSGFARGLDTGFSERLEPDDLAEVVLLGAGGAGAAVGHALLTRGVRHLHVIDRATDRASALASSLAGRFPDRTVVADAPSALPHVLADSRGLVHATPVGMSGHPGLPLPVDLLHPSLWVIDIVNRPLRTELLASAERLGCRTMHGGAMLVLQAADAIALITGVIPDDARMLEHFGRLVTARHARPA